MLKRVLSLCLSVALVLSMVPAQAFATETEVTEPVMETIPETTAVETTEAVTEPAGTSMPPETGTPETAAPTAAETVPETTAEETVPETREETIPETTMETVPETTEETVPEITEETVPEETVEETVPEETVEEETVAEEAMAASGSCGTYIGWNYANGVLTIAPSSIFAGDMNDYTTSSRPGWYSYRTGIKEVVIESGVWSVGDYAFASCEKLERVTLANSVVDIGQYAFQGCVSLAEITSLKNMNTISTGAFYKCSKLTSVNLDYVSEVGSQAFKECTSLTSATVSLAGASWDVTLGDSIFSGCTKLKEVTLHVNPAKYMFENCTALEKVNLSTYYNKKEIGYGAFQGCTGLKTIEIPSNITTIGSYAFKNAGLKYIYFKGDAPTIQSTAFSGVSGAYAKYPYSNTTWTSSKKSNYGGTLYWNYDNRCGDGVTWSFNSSTGVLTISGSGDMADYASSSSQPWYKERSNITKVVVNSGITGIGKNAFYYCRYMTSVSIPTTVKAIGDYAFYTCDALTGVTIPSSVKIIGNYAFTSCYGLKNLTLNSGLTDIGNNAFQGCYNLTTVTLPESVATIGTYAFSGCTGLTTMTIPANVTSIGGMAFGGCNGLTEIWVNPANKFYSSDDYGVFYDKQKTVLIKAPTCLSGSFTIPDTVETVAIYAFDDCIGLTEVTIPDSVTTIEQCAFYYCSGLTTVNMGSGVTAIGKQAFDNCAALTSLVIPEGVTDIGDNTFNKCISLKNVTIPSTVTKIGTKAFYDCDSLESVSIPAAVSSIGSQAFSSCDALKKILVAEDNAKYAGDERGVLFNKDMTTLIQTPGGMVDGYAVPHTVTTINSYAFENCKMLMAVYIPSNVVSIKYAFYGCLSGLVLYCEEYSVPGGWDSDWNRYGGSSSYVLTVKWGVSAEEGAFWVADAFQEQVEIPEYLSSLPENAFYGHTNLKRVTIPNSITSLPKNAFYGCTALTKVNFPKRLTTISSYAFYGCTGFKAFFIPATVTTIEASAFISCASDLVVYCEPTEKPSGWNSSWCSYSTTVIWGATAESSAFWTSEEAWKAHVVIPEGITEIPDYAFYKRTDLLSVTVPDSVKTIGQRAFYGCTGLTRLPDMPGVISIDSYAFGGCTGIKHLRIPYGVTTLNDNAFYGCTELLTVYIPASVTTMNGSPFYKCKVDLKICCEVAAKPESWGMEWLEHGFSGYIYMQNAQYGINGITYDFFTSDATQSANVVIPEGVTLIPGYAFQGRTDLLSITIPSTVTDIREFAFCECTNLTTVIISGGVGTIGNYAFYGCTGLTTVTIPGSVTSGGGYAFKDCTGLTEVTFAEGLSIIGSSMFSGCTGLTQVTIPGSVKTVGDYAFLGCTGLTKITIGSGVTSIGKNAFRGCTGLTQVYIPASVTYMPGEARTISTYDPATDTNKTTGVEYSSPFYDCSSALELCCEVASKPSGWSSYWNTYGANFYAYTNYVSYSARYLQVTWGIPASELDFWTDAAQKPDVVIPDYITKIPVSAFDGRKDLKRVTIGSSVTEIGETAFRGCTSLTSVTIGENVKTIGDYAFSGCTGLKEITIPETVTKVGNGAFNSCSASLVINYGGTMAQWMKVGYSPCTVRCSDGTISGFGSCGGYAKWTLMNGTLRIYGSGTMNGFANTDPGWYAQRSEITSVVVEQGVTSIGYYAFRNCTKLETVEIAASVNTISNYAFYSCSNMKSITFMGRAPTFNANSFASSRGTVYYSVKDTSWTESVRQNYGGTLTWVAKCLGDHVVVVDKAVPATCTTSGVTEGSHCSACGMILVAQKTVSALGHDLCGWYDSTEATCTKAGVLRRDCSRCDFNETKIVYALGHNEVIDPAVAPTCLDTGLTEGKHCDRCGEVFTTRKPVAALGHAEVTDPAVAPTCTETGLTEGKHCSRCNLTLVAQRVVPVTDHPYGTWATKLAPTCTAEGSESRSCTTCGHTETRAIKALGHNEVIDPAVAAACLTTGLTEGKHCARCNAVLTAQTVTPALGHKEVADPAVAPTCTVPGKTAGSHCARCNLVLTAQNAVSALGHIEVVDPAVAPTCTATGKTEGKHCSRCNGVLVAQKTVAALGHMEIIDKAVAPTCLETGLTEGKHCDRCKAVLIAQKTLAALGHEEVVDAAVAPTCLNTGLTEGKHCGRCNEILLAQNEIPALGHEEVTDAAVEPTCLDTGLTEGKHCGRCNEILVPQNVVPALGHEEVIDAAVVATCLETGLTEGKHCARCQDILVAQKVVAAKGHDYLYGICQACGHEIPSDYQLYAGKALTLKLTDPATGKAYTAKQLTWTMEDIFEPFATLKNGKLTAKKVVERVRMAITATVVATNEPQTFLVDIYPAVTQVEVLWEGETVANNAAVLMDFSEEAKRIEINAYPEDTLTNVQWTVSDKKNQYAFYEMNGDTLTITAPTGKAGTVTVKATVDAGVKKTVTVKVNFGSFAWVVTIMDPPKTTLRGGESMSVQAYVSEPKGVSKPGVTWSTSDKNVASVSGNKVTAKNVTHPAAVTITATSKDGQASADLVLTILPKDEGKLVLMEGGKFVTNGTKALNVGDSCQLSAAIVSNGEATGAAATWTSSKATVATVDETGRITATGAGTAKITAAFNGKTAILNIKVATLVGAMEITTKDGKNIVEEKGEKLVLLSSGKNVALVANILTPGAAKTVDWAITEGAQYAKISGGKVTANKDLTKPVYVTVKATAKDGSGASAAIRVKILPLATGVQIFENGNRVRSNTVYMSDLTTNPVIRLSARVYPAGANQKVILTSSSKKIADFNDNGELVCYKTGTVTITATAQDGSNMKTTFKLTILKKVTGLALKAGLPVDEAGNLFVAGGKSMKLAPMVEITPSDATNKKLTWSVSPNPYGITISSAGVLSTKKVPQPVTVNIMVRPQDGSGCILAFNVTVYPV